MFSKLQSLVSKADVVSFDIFDTLISRPLFSPFDVFDRVAELFYKEQRKSLPGFRKIRTHCEESCRQSACNLQGFQDVTIDEIYSDIACVYDLTDEETKSLIMLEKSVERKFLRTRLSGDALYRAAAGLFKDVILISDMYLDRKFILDVMKENGYRDFIELYLSSELRLRKKEGDLFKHVIYSTGCSPGSILHIGDNAIGDTKVPQALGLVVFRTPRAVEHMGAQSENWRTICDYAKKSRTFSQSLVLGLTADRLFDNSANLPQKNTDFGGDPFTFGYAAFGPLVAGFASFIHKKIAVDGIEHLLFLSRDGKIIKDVYEILYPDSKASTGYFYASRRALRVAGIKTIADIIGIALQALYSTTVGDFLKDRFGLETHDIQIDVLQINDCEGLDAGIGGKFSKEKLLAIVLAHKDQILGRARYERENLIEAFSSLGLEGKKVAVVDIGYAGTMQEGLIFLLGQELFGYYLATFNTIDGTLVAKDHAAGYVKDLAHSNGETGGICTHRFLYETIFCDADSSLVCYEKDGISGDIIPVKNIDHNDNKRQHLVLEVHAGARVLAADITDVLAGEIDDFYLAPDFATRLLDTFLVKPHPLDSLMFEGISFEDSIGPKNLRYIVPPLESLKAGNTVGNAIWKEGFAAAKKAVIAMNKKQSNAKFMNSKKSMEVVTSEKRKAVESFIINRFTSDRLYAKYLRDRHNFFSDSKNSILKFYYKVFG